MQGMQGRGGDGGSASLASTANFPSMGMAKGALEEDTLQLYMGVEVYPLDSESPLLQGQGRGGGAFLGAGEEEDSSHAEKESWLRQREAELEKEKAEVLKTVVAKADVWTRVKAQAILLQSNWHTFSKFLYLEFYTVHISNILGH
jgi:hypothetical protein